MSNSKCLRVFEDSFNVSYAREKQRDGKHIYVNFVEMGQGPWNASAKFKV